MRARLALRQAGQRVELREVALRAKPAELLAASIKGTVPVLLLPDGGMLEQSLDIMRWALARSDPQGWLSAAPAAEQARWIELCDARFKPLLDRYKYPERFPAEPAQHHREAACALLLRPLEQALALSGAWLFGPQCSLADMALLPFVRQFAAVDAAWFETQTEMPALRAWLQRFVEGDLFKAVMQERLPPWVPGQAPVYG
ncbi:UPF0176 protein [Paucibacter oligotrophus]|uniref:UPF0176 protein n=2 Tax=Roseateles oligotrophus TaxID=1769250 RepID=A0A840L3M1_9BURK|nr:UPF0176 protein [Roseateles oligotrophus]